MAVVAWPLPSPYFEHAHLDVTKRLTLTDADPAIQRAFALTYRDAVGKAALEWIISELYVIRYRAGGPIEAAVVTCEFQQFAEQLKDITRRGLALLEAEEQAAAKVALEADAVAAA